MSFDKLGLGPAILKAVAKQGYDTPSPIQAQSIPAILKGKDVTAAAQTGTGKTAGFTLPILERLSKGSSQGLGAKSNQVRALILTPTRELAAQVATNVENYSEFLEIKSTVVYGGVKINPQMMKLRKGVDILVATPGRLLDLYNQNALKFDRLEVLVLDEADRMLDMGFYPDIRKILALLPKRRQNLLFSATFSEEIKELARGLVINPVEISVNPKTVAAVTVEQKLYATDKNKKSGLLKKLIKAHNWWQVLVFVRTKQGANRLTRQLDDAGITALAIHGNKSQGARTKALEQFKAGDIQVLVATDIAARGLDIEQLPCVVNFDLPHVSEDYVHRIGRTGRAGSEGLAISLVCAAEFDLLVAIERVIQQKIARLVDAEFEGVNALPPSPEIKPFKKKKPKKPKKPKVADKHQAVQGKFNFSSHSNSKKSVNANNKANKPKPKPARRRRPKPKNTKPKSQD